MYAANVPHFIPRLTPWSEADDRRFSWALVTSNREWPWGVVLAGVMTAIWYVDLWSPFARALD